MKNFLFTLITMLLFTLSHGKDYKLLSPDKKIEITANNAEYFKVEAEIYFKSGLKFGCLSLNNHHIKIVVLIVIILNLLKLRVTIIIHTTN